MKTLKIDPTKVRLSNSFLLSDFLGNHSVYTLGLPNIYDDPDGSKMAEGVCLAENVLEPIAKESPLTISYSYISLDVARQVVKYQSPEKPSYHQWNYGAAADIIVHRVDAEDIPPIYIARAFDEEFPVSRVITYSESPFICVATRRKEVDVGTPRRAFYENRYEGVAKQKPHFSEVWRDRGSYFDNIPAYVNEGWRGAGYPTYHGGGIRQAQHVRAGRYSMLSDFLYSTEAITCGYKNMPSLDDATLEKFCSVGDFYADLLDLMGINRLSIVRAYESPRWAETSIYNWSNGEFAIDCKPPESISLDDVADAAKSIPCIDWAEVNNDRVEIGGRF